MLLFTKKQENPFLNPSSYLTLLTCKTQSISLSQTGSQPNTRLRRRGGVVSTLPRPALVSQLVRHTSHYPLVASGCVMVLVSFRRANLTYKPSRSEATVP